MPWKATSVLEQRIQFILEWKKRVHDVASLCRVFGISRQTGYKLIRRYLAAGQNVRALEDLSRRPRTSPHATRALVVQWIIVERRKHSHWGPRKLRVALAKRLRDGVCFRVDADGAALERNRSYESPELRRDRGPVEDDRRRDPATITRRAIAR